MAGRLDGKVALISGGARGQGEAEARRFVVEGARVVIGDVLVDEGEAVARDLGDACTFTSLDVTDEASWAGALDVADTAYGALHVLVNNAGILRFGAITTMPVEELRQVLEVNVVGVFLGMKAAAPVIERSGGGSIVNISSVGGMWGIPFAGAYTASKYAVRGLTKSAALELGRKGIRVNSVHPGGVDTAMTRFEGMGDAEMAGFYAKLPIPRVGTVDDVANLVLFLASDESAYCTGAEFLVEGGATAGDLSLYDPR
jgi:3alpha(or 20beta)-hydroxysteroid dehydrogenase